MNGASGTLNCGARFSVQRRHSCRRAAGVPPSHAGVRAPRRFAAILLAVVTAACLSAQTVETVEVISKTVERKSRLPADLRPYLQTGLHARVSGFVDSLSVDRGSVVKKGQTLAVLSAPEMKAHVAEAEAKVQTAESQRAEAEARLLAAQSTFEKLKEAAKTPGAIAGNELLIAEKTVEANRAAVAAAENSARAAKASVESLRELLGYLQITSPFDGVITERRVHPGALVGPNSGALLELEQTSRLRLVVAVPEADVSGIVRGASVPFTVPAYPGRSFLGSIARVAHSVDAKTRTMAVELDVANPQSELAPGMYAEVSWPVRKARPSLLVPPSSVVTTTERTFVVRDHNGTAEWVNVRKGAPAGDLVEVFGNLNPGDRIVRRASDELREGTPLKIAAREPSKSP